MSSLQIDINLFKFLFIGGLKFVSTHNSSLFYFYTEFTYLVKDRFVNFKCLYSCFDGGIGVSIVVVGEIGVIERFFRLRSFEVIAKVSHPN